MTARILAARGVRSGSGRGLPATLAAATATVLADPGMWLLGALSFSLRGGVAVMVLPILWVPSPVLLSVFFGRFITTSGLSPDVLPAAVAVGLVLGLALVVAVLLASYTQLVSFERTATSNETAGLRAGAAARSLRGRERFATVMGLAALHLLGLIAVLLTLPAVGRSIGAAGLAELQYPTSLDTPFALTVLSRVKDELLLLAAAVVLMDLLVTLAAHQLLARRFGFAPQRLLLGSGSDASGGAALPRSRHADLAAVTAGLARLIREPLQTLFLASVAWLVTIGTLAVVIGGTLIGWDTLRAMLFRTPAGGAVDGQLALVGQLVALAVFGAIWVAGITLAGLASSLRGALWASNALR